MRIVGDRAQRFPLTAPRKLAADGAPSNGKSESPIKLVKSSGEPGRPND